MTSSPAFLLRLLLALIAAILLLGSLAYYLTDGLAHEIIGSTMFAFVIVHNVLNRGWYSALSRIGRTPRSRLNLTVTFVLLLAMLTLLVTSVMISNALFSFFSPGGSFTARQIHVFAAYLVLIVVSVHLGLRWPTIMHVARQLLGVTDKSARRTLALRLAALVIAVQGIWSSFALDVGTKLSLEPSLDWWDFEASVTAFFLHILAVMGLYVSASYYTVAWLQRRQRVQASDLPARSR